MKRIITLSLALVALIPCKSAAWGRLGHATAAEIAQRHLTATARANIEHYTHGEPLATYGCWMDEMMKIEPFKTEFAGWHASIADQNCNSPIYIRKEHRNCRDGVTVMEFYREYLKDYHEMSDSVVLNAIRCIVHVIGDFHCPEHVRFTDCLNEGKFMVTYLGKEVRFHNFWDSTLLYNASGLKWTEYETYADRLDTWSRRQIRAVSKGWAREWFEDAARDIRPMIHEVKEGDTLPDDYVEKHIGLAEMELRKAGYQIAAALNEIFGK